MKHQEKGSPRRLGAAVSWLSVGVLPLALALALAGVPEGASAQASLVSPLGANQVTLSDTDDGAEEVSLTTAFPSGIRLGATVYTTLYIGTNGYVTFGHPNNSYNPLGIPGYASGPIVAAQFDDLDPSKAGDIYYAQNASAGSGAYVLVTFQNVAPYSTAIDGSGTNSFQIVLRRIGGPASQNFQIELRYAKLDWAGSGSTGAPPTAGWSFGDRVTYAELDHSGLASFRTATLSGSNVGQPGVYRWDVTGGVVQTPPTVNATSSATGITATTAQSGGSITSAGSAAVTARGVVYATTQTPSLSDDVVTSGSGTGSFAASLAGLSQGTTYYVRAYGTNSVGTAYGPQISFTTQAAPDPPSVSAGTVSSVTSSGASVSGTVIADGGAAVTARGVVYATTTAPTVADDVAAAGSGTGSFSASLIGLAPRTTYYARAFATNSVGTTYAPQASFTTEPAAQTITFGVLPSPEYGDGPVTVAVSASSGLAVSLESGDTTVAVVSGGQLVLRGAGTSVITASQAGDATYAAATPVQRTLTVARRPVVGHFTVREKTYDGSDLATVTARWLTGVLSADTGRVTLAGGVATFADAAIGEGTTVTLTGATLAGARAARYDLASVQAVTGSIVAGPPHAVTLSGAVRVSAGAPSDYVVGLVDEHGKATAASATLVFELGSSRAESGGTFHPRSVSLAAGDSVASFTYTPTKASGSGETIHAQQVSGLALAGGTRASLVLQVSAGPLAGFMVELPDSILERGADVGAPVPVRITAVDAAFNPVPSFVGPAELSASLSLASGSGTTGAFEQGVLEGHWVVFDAAGTARLTVSGQGRATTSPSFEVFYPDARLSVVVEAEEERPALGSVITVRIRVANLGRFPAEEATLGNPLAGQERIEPLEVTVNRGEMDQGTGIWRIGTLEAGEEALMTVRARVVVP